MTLRLPRRTVLRALGGVTVGLPVLECMLDSKGEALAASGALPRRYAIVFAGQAIGGDGWAEDRSMVAGERITEATRSIYDYLLYAREFDKLFPGFETDIHGLRFEAAPGGRRYLIDCVSEDRHS